MTIATRYYPYNLTLLPGSTAANPVVTPLAIEPILLRKVDVRIPPGPRGDVGFYVTLAGTAVIPWGLPPTYLILDGEPVSFEVNAEAGANIAIVAYNTGAYAHTLYFRLAGTPVSLLTPGISFATITPIEG